mgnify:CR=1 FL=1
MLTPGGHQFEESLKLTSELAAIDITYYDFGIPGTPTRCTLGLGSDGTCFVPAVMHPQGADGAFVKAGLDKIMVGQHKGNLYVPSDWLIQQFAGDPLALRKEAVVRRMVEALKMLPVIDRH